MFLNNAGWHHPIYLGPKQNPKVKKELICFLPELRYLSSSALKHWCSHFSGLWTLTELYHQVFWVSSLQMADCRTSWLPQSHRPNPIINTHTHTHTHIYIYIISFIFVNINIFCILLVLFHQRTQTNTPCPAAFQQLHFEKCSLLQLACSFSKNVSCLFETILLGLATDSMHLLSARDSMLK